MNRVAVALAPAPGGSVGMAGIELQGVEALCDPLGALWLPAASILVVSDLHLEKGAAFARRGMMLPPYDTALTLNLLETVIARTTPSCVVSLGDSFHDRRGAAELTAPDTDRLKTLMKGRDWYWIAGNHDPDRPVNLPGDHTHELRCDGLVFRHEPAGKRTDATGEIAGHLHPAARVVRRGKGVRRACFATDGNRLVMPAFGVMTGTLSLRHPALSGLFDAERLTAHLLGKERVYSVRFGDLAG